MTSVKVTIATTRTDAERAEIRREAIAEGSVAAEIGHCGEDGLPCLYCDECLAHMARFQMDAMEAADA